MLKNGRLKTLYQARSYLMPLLYFTYWLLAFRNCKHALTNLFCKGMRFMTLLGLKLLPAVVKYDRPNNGLVFTRRNL